MKDLIIKFVERFNHLKKSSQICFTTLISFALSYITTFVLPIWGFCISGIVLTFVLQHFLSFAGEYCSKYRPEARFIEDMGIIKVNINNTNIYEIFKNYITTLGTSISDSQLQKLDVLDHNYVDLALELTSFDSKDISVNTSNDTVIKGNAISNIRRERILEICKSLLNKNITLFYATEFHLYDVLIDVTKLNNDKDYRDALHEAFKECDDNGSIVAKKRIIVITEEHFNFLKGIVKYKLYLKQYLQWHIDNQWEAIIYLIDSSTHVTLKQLGRNNKYCNDLTDFLYVEYSHGKNKCEECRVFAQNDQGLCKYFQHPSQQIYNRDPITDFKSAFENLWSHSVLATYPYKVVDQAFIDSL